MATLNPAYIGYGSTSGLPHVYEEYLQGGSSSTTAQAGRGRRRWNFAGLCVAVLLPWVIFAVAFAVTFFPAHIDGVLVGAIQPCYLVCSILLVVVLVNGFFAFVAWRKKVLYGLPEPSWYQFLFAAGLMAWILGIVVGRFNHRAYVAPYLAIEDRAFYYSVDPALVHGQQLMDAGRMNFTVNTRIDATMSYGFRHIDIYCVAPVVSGSGMMATYDFWAVGTNCCSDHAADFHCGEFKNKKARSGVRLLQDDQRPWFLLALQQAEAAYGIRAEHPVFLTWVENPSSVTDDMLQRIMRFCLWWIVAYFAFQVLLVSGAVAVLSFLGW
mmetsp:Transcript_150585/g.419716  ORF Transcript_150585/g.419716 Transcript_150585/m.419716 type:complete len:325 (-) Transcript_150585:336-1310(-)